MPENRSASDKMMVQVRLPRELVREVDHFSINKDLYRAQAFETLLREGLKHLDQSN